MHVVCCSVNVNDFGAVNFYVSLSLSRQPEYVLCGFSSIRKNIAMQISFFGIQFRYLYIFCPEIYAFIIQIFKHGSQLGWREVGTTTQTAAA